MKRKYVIPVLLAVVIGILIPSCKKDNEDFHRISDVERAVHNKINEFRTSKGLNEMVEQFLLFKNARTVSDKLAKGTYTMGDPEINTFVQDLTTNLGGNGYGYVTLATNYEDADSIVNSMLSDSATVVLIEKTYTQSGVGVSMNDDGSLYYVCQILINIP